MKSQIQLVFIILSVLFFSVGNAVAATCYDPNYGYYDCDSSYYNYPDSSEAFMEGAFVGVVLGGMYNNEGYYQGNNNHWNNGGQGNWGGHGGGWNGGGGRHH